MVLMIIYDIILPYDLEGIGGEHLITYSNGLLVDLIKG